MIEGDDEDLWLECLAHAKSLWLERPGQERRVQSPMPTPRALARTADLFFQAAKQAAKAQPPKPKAVIQLRPS